MINTIKKFNQDTSKYIINEEIITEKDIIEAVDIGELKGYAVFGDGYEGCRNEFFYAGLIN